MNIMIGIGGTDSKRRLALVKWIELIELIKTNYPNFTITLLGNDSELINFNCVNLKFSFEKFCATNINDLKTKISQADFIITNETSVYHIANLFNIKSIVVLGGGHFGRFVNLYNVNSFPIFKYKECFLCDWKCKFKLSKNDEYQCISSITSADIYNLFLKINNE